MEKRYKIPSEQMRNLAPGYGACFATDKITVDGEPVGFMYREEPDNEIDSGWRFLAGTESEEYLNDSRNLSIWDVNTIANYDPDIVPYLNAPIRSAFERTEDDDFVETDFQPPPEDKPGRLLS
jgi:hypothetical protein